MPEGLERGTSVRIISGRYTRRISVIDSSIYGESFDFPGIAAMSYGVVLDDDEWIVVRQDQVGTRFRKSLDRDG